MNPEHKRHQSFTLWPRSYGTKSRHSPTAQLNSEVIDEWQSISALVLIWIENIETVALLSGVLYASDSVTYFQDLYPIFSLLSFRL